MRSQPFPLNAAMLAQAGVLNSIALPMSAQLIDLPGMSAQALGAGPQGALALQGGMALPPPPPPMPQPMSRKRPPTAEQEVAHLMVDVAKVCCASLARMSCTTPRRRLTRLAFSFLAAVWEQEEEEAARGEGQGGQAARRAQAQHGGLCGCRCARSGRAHRHSGSEPARRGHGRVSLLSIGRLRGRRHHAREHAPALHLHSNSQHFHAARWRWPASRPGWRSWRPSCCLASCV
jgi:hypothetical protein